MRHSRASYHAPALAAARAASRDAAGERQAAQAATFRTRLIDAVAPFAGLPLLLSGGVDSATTLAALLAAGTPPPRAYTFQLGDMVSSDVRVATLMCQHFAIPHTVITIPRDQTVLLADIRRVLPLVYRLKKTHIQVAHPFLYLAPAIRADGFTDALVAMAADDLWGSARRIAGYVKSRGEDWCREMRRSYITFNLGTDRSVERTAASFSLALRDPWAAPPVVDFLLACDYADLHAPVLKGLALRAFPGFWRAGAWYRPNSSLQVNSGLREWHDTLLSDPAVNPSGARAVIALYRRLAEDLGVTFPFYPDHLAGPPDA